LQRGEDTVISTQRCRDGAARIGRGKREARLSSTVAPEVYAEMEQAIYEAAVVPEHWPEALRQLIPICDRASRG